MKVKIIGMQRHRMGIDGHGITTLVGFHGCPLYCKYCLNPQCHTQGAYKELETTELYSLLKRDELYYLATRGGITFGGGEPCMHSEFVEEFRRLCGLSWMINVETCLNVPVMHIKRLCKVVDTFYVDIKDMNSEIYFKYTGKSNELVYSNLHLLSDCCKNSETPPKVVIRIPSIPGFNRKEDQEHSISVLRKMGFDQFDRFTYNTEYGKRKAEM